MEYYKDNLIALLEIKRKKLQECVIFKDVRYLQGEIRAIQTCIEMLEEEGE